MTKIPNMTKISLLKACRSTCNQLQPLSSLQGKLPRGGLQRSVQFIAPPKRSAVMVNLVI